MSAEMPELTEHLFGALQELAAVLEQFGVRYALIGGMASAFYWSARGDFHMSQWRIY